MSTARAVLLDFKEPILKQQELVWEQRNNDHLFYWNLPTKKSNMHEQRIITPFNQHAYFKAAKISSGHRFLRNKGLTRHCNHSFILFAGKLASMYQ